MLIVFATIVVDAGERAEIAAAMLERLNEIAPKDNGAIEFQLLVNASDPGRIHVFQTWESLDAFQAWGTVDAHVAFQAEFRRYAKEFSSVQYVGEALPSKG